jgi:hypothetical protein
MQSLKSPVGTHCVGFAYNLAGFLLTAGEKVIFSLLESVLMKVFLPVPRDVLLLILGEHLIKVSQKKINLRHHRDLGNFLCFSVLRGVRDQDHP